MPLLSDSSRQLAAALTITALVIAGLILGKEVLLPLAAATLLAFILSPIVSRATALGLPRGVSVAAVLLLLLAGIGAMSVGVTTQILSLTASLPQYRQNIIDKVRIVTGVRRQEGTIKRASDAIESLGTALAKEIETPAPGASAPAGATGPTMNNSAPASAGITSTAKPAPDKAEPKVVIAKESSDEPAWKQVGVLIHPAASVALTLLLVMFLLLQHNDLRDRLVRVAGTDNLSGTTAAMSDAGERLSRLFLTQAVLNFSFGAFVGVALWVIGVPNAPLWGVMTAFLRFVPFIGSFLSAIPPLLLAAAVEPGWTMLLATLALFLIGEPIMGHVIEPLVLGDKAGLSPFAMVASASFWTLVWGPVGLILAAPMTMVLVVLGRYIPGLEVFTVLLGDQPALKPSEEFYHRLLSKDGIAAGEQLEEAIEEGSIVAASDQIVLPGLQLAVMDERLGRLDRDQLESVRSTMMDVNELITELAPSVSADESGVAVDVLVIPARGAIDTTAAEFVANVVAANAGGTSSAFTSASGLTALAEARAQAKGKNVDVVVVTTMGAVERQQLRFIVERATATFPNSRVVALDFARRETDYAGPSKPGSTKTDTQRSFSAYQRMSDLVSAIQAAARSVPKASEKPRAASTANPKTGNPVLADGQLVPAV